METFLVYSGVALFALVFVGVFASNFTATGKAASAKQSKQNTNTTSSRAIEYSGGLQTGRTSPSHRHH